MSNESLSEIKVALDAAEEELQACYRKLWPLRAAYAEIVPPAAQPRGPYRTDKQKLVERCPRCGGRLKENDD